MPHSDLKNLPRHVAIIMDGNGRWAEGRDWPRIRGHEEGTLIKNDVRLTAIGRLDDLPRPVRRELDATRQLTAAHRGLNLCLALSYGGRAELVDAMRSIAAAVAAGRLDPSRIDEALIAQRLYQPGIDPDLVIRTAGEMRVSNFLLWQISYSEIVISDVCWPDFRTPQLHAAIAEYGRRVRKFGGLVRRPAASTR
jgi:undecaprenyl diphosphate synthase